MSDIIWGGASIPSPELTHNDQEVLMLKRQTAMLQDQVERCLRMHQDTVKAQQEITEVLKRDMMLQRRIHEEDAMRLRDVTLAEIKDEWALLKGRVLQLETGLIGSSEAVSTHIGPLRARVEQLSSSFHSALGSLRQEMGRVRASMDSYTASSTQLSTLLPTISDMQTELGALVAMVREHSTSIGGLHSTATILAARVDKCVRALPLVSSTRNHDIALHAPLSSFSKSTGVNVQQVCAFVCLFY